MTVDMELLNRNTGVLTCLECGKCTAVCPVSRVGGAFSPRSLMSLVVNGDHDSLAGEARIWDCLTCGQCQARCPHRIDFSVYCRSLRVEARTVRNQGNPSHDGALQEIMALQASETLVQRRLEWIPDDLKVRETGEVLYFTGCLPHYDAYFDHMGLGLTDIGISAIRLLNHLGVEPVVMADERCCGHDLIWSGDENRFLELARLNVEAVKRSGAKTILFSCAECYRTLAREYAAFADRVGTLDVKMMHLAEYLAERIDEGELRFGSPNGTAVTYHDPCRLGRQMEVYEAPRKVLSALCGDGFSEMPRHGPGALCCGTSSWMNCDMTSRMIQSARLEEAGRTGADRMITACPKCLIHFACTKTDPNLPEKSRVEVVDLCVAAAKAL